MCDPTMSTGKKLERIRSPDISIQNARVLIFEWLRDGEHLACALGCEAVILNENHRNQWPEMCRTLLEVAFRERAAKIIDHRIVRAVRRVSALGRRLDVLGVWWLACARANLRDEEFIRQVERRFPEQLSTCVNFLATIGTENALCSLEKLYLSVPDESTRSSMEREIRKRGLGQEILGDASAPDS